VIGLAPHVVVLVGKELRQVRRSRGAMATATLMPFLLMTVMPLLQVYGVRASGMGGQPSPTGWVPPGLAEIGDDPARAMVRVMLPMFLVISGLMVPSVAATYTIVAEREKRSIELLMALPARVRDVLLAKLLAMLVLAAAVVLPLFAVDAAVLLWLGLADLSWLAVQLLLLLAALACSVGVALLLALLARDFRTANNLNGAFMGPTIVATMAILFLVPSPLSYLILGAALLALAVGTVQVGLRWITFERYVA
jgi:ABC-2 type transport system permease protein